MRISSREEIAYSPISSVRTMTKLVVLPAPDTAKKNCSQDISSLISIYTHRVTGHTATKAAVAVDQAQ